MKTLGTPQPDSDVVNKEPSVLLIGFGWVGQYMGKYFTQAHVVEGSGVFTNQQGAVVEPRTFYEIAIISVPTPMDEETGECDISIVEEVVEKYEHLVGIFLIKSTVSIGTCEYLEEKYGVAVCMSPEYVGETLGHPLLEARRDAFQIIGGNETAREIVASNFMKVLNANAEILLCESREAEIIKLCENYWITQRVAYWNDVYDICKAARASFQTVRNGICLDPRMSRTHSNVYPDNRGFSGKCLPKDMNNLVNFMRDASDTPLVILEKLLQHNAEYWRKDYKNSVKLVPDKPPWRE